MKMGNRKYNVIKMIPQGAKSGFVYTFATLFSKGLAIITVPIFTRIMSSEQIGIVNLYNSWYSLITIIATLALTSGGFAVAMKEFENNREDYISSVLTITTIISICLALIYFINPSFWDNLLGLPRSLMILMLVGLIFSPARDFWMARERYEYKYKTPAVVIMLSALLASGISIYVVIVMSNNNCNDIAVGRLYANYIVLYGVAATIWAILMLKGNSYFNFDYWKFSLKLSIPLIGYQIAAQILSVSDRIMIDKFVSKSAVGIYGTIYTVSSISLMVWNAINASFVPYLFQNIDSINSRIKEHSYNLLLAYSALAVLLSLFAPEIVKVLAPPEYYEAIYIMPPITAGIIFTSVTHMYSNILVYYKKTKYIMYGAIVGAIFNILSNIIFIPIFGYRAAAYTTLLGYILMAIVEAKWAISIHKKESGSDDSVYDNSKIMILSIVTMALTMSGIYWYTNPVLRYCFAGIFTLFSTFIIFKAISSWTSRVSG